MGHTVEILARTYAHVISEYRGRGPIAPDALITRARRRETPQKRPKPHHQQLELLKPTGGLEPPTPSLRVMADGATPAYARRREPTFPLHSHQFCSDALRQA